MTKFTGELTAISTNSDGNTYYHFSGILGLTAMLNAVTLKEGDMIKDNNGMGMYGYVSRCEVCEQIYITGSRLYDWSCDGCYSQIKQERLYK